ncbi:MAG: methionyl-tRNA formyltransferase, partial [Candidatus Paceibacteria bacterium]
WAPPGHPTSGIFKLQKFRTEEKLVFSGEIDLCIVVAYGKILPEELIMSPRLGSINIHYSLLPKYRGASPVESAILNGDTETGVSIQQMEFKMDAGPIIAEEKVKILPTETTEELRARLIQIGGELLVKKLPDILEQKIQPHAQDESQATFCKKIKKEDGLVDPFKDDPKFTYNKFRAYHKWPRIYYFDENKKRVIITDATLLEGKFVIKKIIPEGGKERAY